MKESQRSIPNCPKCGNEKSTSINSGRTVPDMFEDATFESELVPIVTRQCNDIKCMHTFDVAHIELFVLV
jgi:hypothetical protein